MTTLARAIAPWRLTVSAPAAGCGSTGSEMAGAPDAASEGSSVDAGTDAATDAGAPFLTTDPDVWCMEIGAFHFMTIDLKPTKANQTWQLDIISRLPPGDVFNSAQAVLPGSFGPAPEVGYGTFVGSISGTTLTVTANVSGLNVQAGSWLTGAGLAPDTYISGPAQATGGPGVYTVSPSQTVASTTISAQRTNMYKVSLIDLTSDPDNVYYADKMGFTAQ